MKTLKWYHWALLIGIGGYALWRSGFTLFKFNAIETRSLPPSYRLVKGDPTRVGYPDSIVRDMPGGMSATIAYREGIGWRTNYQDPRYLAADQDAVASAIFLNL